MTKAHQKGVRKVNEMKIKVRETSGDHQGYIEWIEMFDFGNLPVEDRRTNEGRWKIFTDLLTETSQTSYGSASAWIFFTETIFFTNFKWSLDTMRVERFCSSLLPLFIGKRGRSLPPSSPRRARLLPPEGGAFWRNFLEGPCGPGCYLHPCLLNTPPTFFCWFFFCNVT